ncbi:hypothetical protein CARUB_v10006829mg, partial [Capsella rubella]
MNTNKGTKHFDNMIYNKNDSSVSSFISHLTAAFVSKGVKLVLGFELLLVIITMDYASSVPCLENLVEHRDKNYELVPVFYGISRSTVKQQSGTLSDAFKKLEGSYSADQVNKWRCALAEIAEIKGHEYDAKLSEESKFVEVIVEAVFEILYPTEEIGIPKQQLYIENLLCKQGWGLRTLGILGDPGIGKTVLVKAVFRQMVRDYDVSRFVNDFDKEHSENTLEPLHEEFFSTTLVEEFDLNNSGSKQCHRQKRVLIVLDDARNAKSAMSFLERNDQFGPGSLIIITSRDRQVLEECRLSEIYELNGLNDKDAMKLFTRCLYGKDAIGKNLPMIEIEGLKGNPFALRSYAEKVKSKNTDNMEEVSSNDAFVNTNKNTSMCIYSNIVDDDEHEEYGIAMTTEISRDIVLKTILHGSQNIIFDVKNHTDFDLTNQVAESVSDLRSPCVGRRPSKKVQSLPQRFHRRQLVLLQHFHRRQLVLFRRLACQFYKLWQGYKRFSRLRKINLGHCEKIIQVVELSNAPYLEEIDLQDCKNLENIPDTDELENLHSLDLSGCTGIKYFQEN